MPARFFEYDPEIIRCLMRRPDQALSAEINGNSCRLTIISPRYTDLVYSQYSNVIENDLEYYHSKLGIPALFPHFGLSIDFDKPAEISMHDSHMMLAESAKELLNIFGVLIMRNAYLDKEVRGMGHRNRFPQLNFHVDRIESQVSCYSVYTRNPFDEEQAEPRSSSTLFIPMLVGYLQGLCEGKTELLSDKGTINNSILFDPENIDSLLNRLIVQHAWDEPHGTGEISMINNCNILHASYYPDIYNKGYRIGVRYLA